MVHILHLKYMDKIHPMGVFDSMKDVMKETFDVQGGFDEVGTQSDYMATSHLKW